MNPEPVIVDYDTSIHQAARVIYETKATSLLVTKAGKLAGIITLVDMFRVFVETLDMLQATDLLNLTVPKGLDLEPIYEIIHNNGGKIISAALLSCTNGSCSYSFRVENTDIEGTLKNIKELGYQAEKG